MAELSLPEPVAGVASTATTTPMTDAAAQATLTPVRCSPKNRTETGRATTGASAAMINAVAIVTDWMAMKKAQMFSPNSTPASAARRKSTRLGHRLVIATITNKTVEAIHNLQNDSTTPDACVDLPSTPPVDHINEAKIIASTPLRRASRSPTLGGAGFAAVGREVAGVVTWQHASPVSPCKI